MCQHDMQQWDCLSGRSRIAFGWDVQCIFIYPSICFHISFSTFSSSLQYVFRHVDKQAENHRKVCWKRAYWKPYERMYWTWENSCQVSDKIQHTESSLNAQFKGLSVYTEWWPICQCSTSGRTIMGPHPIGAAWSATFLFGESGGRVSCGPFEQ